jgi:hypothetical protein
MNRAARRAMAHKGAKRPRLFPGIAVEFCDPAIDEAFALVKNREALALYQLGKERAAFAIVICGELHRPDGGVVGALIASRCDADTVHGLMQAFGDRLAERVGEVTMNWIVLGRTIMPNPPTVGPPQ